MFEVPCVVFLEPVVISKKVSYGAAAVNTKLFFVTSSMPYVCWKDCPTINSPVYSVRAKILAYSGPSLSKNVLPDSSFSRKANQEKQKIYSKALSDGNLILIDGRWRFQYLRRRV